MVLAGAVSSVQLKAPSKTMLPPQKVLPMISMPLPRPDYSLCSVCIHAMPAGCHPGDCYKHAMGSCLQAWQAFKEALAAYERLW